MKLPSTTCNGCGPNGVPQCPLCVAIDQRYLRRSAKRAVKIAKKEESTCRE